jgi:hypothetical protein
MVAASLFVRAPFVRALPFALVLLAGIFPIRLAVAQTVDDLVGRWGVTSYWKPEDKAKAPGWAKESCGHPYTIAKNAAGNLMMYVADGKLREVKLKGKTLTPVEKMLPEGNAKMHERKITAFAPGSFEATWTNPRFAGRYGTVLYVKCGG